MIVVSGLVLTLFDEARAVEIEFQTAPTTVGGNAEFTVNVKVPQGTRIPVESVVALIERGSTNADPKQGASLVTRATCDFSAVVVAATKVCSNAQLVNNPPIQLTVDTSLARADAVRSIEFVGFFQTQAATGYEVGYGYVFDFGSLSGTTTGYGYDPVFGYGYGAGVTAFGPENGYGYGYSADLFMQFKITVAGVQLQPGVHFLTVGVDTGSPTLGDVLYSPATQFTRSSGGGSPPAGDSGNGAGNTGGNRVTVTTNENPNPPANARSSFIGTVQKADSGTRLVVQTNDPKIQDVEIVLGFDIEGAEVTVSTFPPDALPEGVGELPEGVEVANFVQVKISVGGQTHTLSFAVEIPQNEAGDPNKAVLLKYNPASGKWVPQNRIQLTLSNGVFKGVGTAACCSDFAVAFDETDPTVAIDFATGALSGLQKLTATATDNLMVAQVEFFLGATLLGRDLEAPYEVDFDTKEYNNGDWTLKAVATDFVGNSAEHSRMTTFSNEVQQGDDGGDGDDGGAPKVNSIVPTILLVAAVVLLIVGAVVYFARQQKK